MLKAKDEKTAAVTEYANRLIAQSDQHQKLVQEHNQYYEALARETKENTKVVRGTARTVEAHAFSCPQMDKTKFVAIRSGQGGV